MALALHSPKGEQTSEQAVTQQLHSPEFNDLLENQSFQQEPEPVKAQKNDNTPVWAEEADNAATANEVEEKSIEKKIEKSIEKSIEVAEDVDQALEQTLNEELQTLVQEKDHVEAYIPKEQQQRLANFNAAAGRKGPQQKATDRVPADIKEEVAREMENFESDEISTSAAAPVRKAVSENAATLAPSIEEKVIGSIENDAAVELEARQQKSQSQWNTLDSDAMPARGMHLRRRRSR